MVDAPDHRPIRLQRSDLRAFARALLENAGSTPEHARVVTDHLIEAELMGLKSHGVMRVPQYLDDIASGGIDPAALPVITPLAPGRAALDGRKGFGQVAGMAMVAEAVRLGWAAGVAFVTGRHMGHTGRIGAYPEAIAREGLVGIAVCSGPRSGHWVAPFGGREGRMATNPIAFAYPVRDASPVVADFSTSVVPEGVVRSLMNRGLKAPEGALRDGRGEPTIEPAAIYGNPRGTIQPLGGAAGYRGTALAMLVDVLAALLADDDSDDPKREGSNLGMLAIAANDAFSDRAARMGSYIRSAPALDEARPVMLPGEREQRELARSADAPISVDRPTWSAMLAAAADRVPVPQPVSG